MILLQWDKEFKKGANFISLDIFLCKKTGFYSSGMLYNVHW